MYKSVIDSISSIALSKINFFKDSLFGFIIASVPARMFISFGSFMSMSVGGYCSQLMGPVSKIMSSVFGSGLSDEEFCDLNHTIDYIVHMRNPIAGFYNQVAVKVG